MTLSKSKSEKNYNLHTMTMYSMGYLKYKMENVTQLSLYYWHYYGWS